MYGGLGLTTYIAEMQRVIDELKLEESGPQPMKSITNAERRRRKKKKKASKRSRRKNRGK